MSAVFEGKQISREDWIKYHLQTDFGFREPTDVNALSDEELEAYMKDAHMAAFTIFEMYNASENMYGRTGFPDNHYNIVLRRFFRKNSPVL